MTVATWTDAEKLTSNETVDLYLENFADDPHYDNAVALVMVIMNLTHSTRRDNPSNLTSTEHEI